MSFNKAYHKQESPRRNDGESSRGEMSIDFSIEKESPPSYVTFRKGVTDQNILDLRNEFQLFQTNMMATMKQFFDTQNTKISKFIEDFEELKTSIQFVSDKYDDLKLQTEEIRNRVSALETSTKSSQNKEFLLTELENRLDKLELNSRQCNIEVVNIPERRNESLITILEKIAAAVKHPITKQDVVSIHRVPQLNPKSGRPKNIIIKFSSRILRDNFLAAARTMKSLTTEQLQINGTSQRVYFNEHLTLKKKKLFREVREAAKKYGFKYTWVKHGSILVRASDSSPVIVVHTKEDVCKIQSSA
ncbi:unnamed protein product [Euphydryas editha]|uniref:FP protein C-terminal domain-containing protein n=1 Tax=Euphydryas editha TaxID=104508 RepID=A0AAU9UHW6_EUPED|nr:unnamed protein product [Euphydryas editha]